MPEAQPEVCIVNIGPRERRKRMLGTIVFGPLSVAILAVLVASGAHRLWRLALFLPFAMAAFGWFQARAKT